MIRTLVFPALVEKIVELIPLFEFENGFKLELDDLKVLCDDVRLSRAAELVNAFRSSAPKFLTVLTSFEIVLQLV